MILCNAVKFHIKLLSKIPDSVLILNAILAIIALLIALVPGYAAINKTVNIQQNS